MVQSLVLKNGKLLLLPDKLAMSDGNDCECCEEAPPCGCGALVLLEGVFGFRLTIVLVGGAVLEYCAANPTAGNVQTLGFFLPGLYDPAHPDGSQSQRHAVCDNFVRFGDYRIDTMIDPNRLLKIYFDSDCITAGNVTGWEDQAGGVEGVTQISSIVIGDLCPEQLA